MPVWGRMGGFLFMLAGVFGVALLIGTRWGPTEVDTAAGHEDVHAAGSDGAGEHGSAHDGRTPDLKLAPDRVRAGETTVAFRLIDHDAEPLTELRRQHGKLLHLIVVDRASLTEYRHLHPALRPDGRWTVQTRLPAGDYRLYADGMAEDGTSFVAEADLVVTGDRPVVETPAPTVIDRVDGYDVSLARVGDQVTLVVSRGGRPVDHLQPYLGATGHLVAIRSADLGYLHAHPVDAPAGPAVPFEVSFAGPGAHRLFFDFKHGGRVHTAAFTLPVGGGADDSGGHGEDGHEH